MAQIRTFLGLSRERAARRSLALAGLALVACSAGGGGANTGLSGGDGGSSATGTGGVGAVSAGGSSATGTGGSLTTGGSGGTIDPTGSGGDTAGNAGNGGMCPGLHANSTPVVPTVLLLVDNSSSMFEMTSGGTTAWKLLYDALMGDTGPIKSLQSTIRFGFTSYKGHQGTSESDPACATMTPSMPTFATDAYLTINGVYEPLGSEVNNGPKWETPTGHAIATVVPDLVAFNSDPPGPKYILLVTDGNPNTCVTLDPQCGQDRTIKAVQDAYAQKIGTFVIGIGDIVAQPNNGCPQGQARCGNDHLQDIANAGTGLPVEAPPADYIYQPCVQNEGAALTATYAPAGTAAGTAEYFATNDGAKLGTYLATLLNSVQSCTFDLDAVVTGNPAGGVVTLDGSAVPYGDTAAGWKLEDNKYQVTLVGTACDTYRSGPGHSVDVNFPCVGGKPIAEPR